jgi:hypothetical protein
MKPGTLVTVFKEHNGVVIKAPPVEGMVCVLYQTTNGIKIRANVPVGDVKERDVT